jgi:hypothetical protein
MPTDISGNGATQYVSLRMNAGLVQYSIDQTNWFNIAATANWPVTIINTNPSAGSILRVVVTENLIITGGYGGTSGYFIAGSTYITFDGSGNTINMNNITSYPGFIQNGTNAANGFANVIVKNFTTAITSSTLGSDAGWLCQEFFGKGVSGNEITNSTNTCAISGSVGGGIAGRFAGGYSGSLTFTGCTNTGVISGQNAGGIAGTSAGFEGSVSFTNCINNGLISGNSAGGIAGQGPGAGNIVSGSASFTTCTNTGNISGENAGGIVGQYAGIGGGLADFTGCTNTGQISGLYAGGIAGSGAGNSGSATFTDCANTGDITSTAIAAGGIVGVSAAGFSGSATLTNCFSTGIINGQYAGGIAGAAFAFNTSINCVISQCYSTGAISGSNAGGIVGADVGYNDNNGGPYTPVVNITNSYSLGGVDATAGGIVGGGDPSLTYINTPSINVTNCYSYGALDPFTLASGITSIYYPKPVNESGCYIANNNWSDTAAAISGLTGIPTNINTNNPGLTWTTLAADTPYVLSSYNAALYSPNSASSFTNYTSSPGLFQGGGYNYDLVYTTQVGNTATANVFVSKGTAPYYSSYNFNTFQLTNVNGGSGRLISAAIDAPSGVLTFILPYPCFLEGTKILCFENNEEVYRPVESLRKGDLVKTIYNGYLPVHMIGTSPIYNPGNDYRITNRLYKCSKENYPALFEDLYITGCHSILVPAMTDDQWENTKAVNGTIYVTDKHFRLIACADEKAEPYNKEGFMNIYHIALENTDYYMNYGIYANGLLVESCSKRYLTEISNMRILGEDDCAVSENIHIEGVISQLVETY